MVYVLLLLIAVVVVVLMTRAAAGPGRPRGGGTRRLPRPPRPPKTGRPLAPDDDPEFLRELERRARRDDGSKNA